MIREDDFPLARQVNISSVDNSQIQFSLDHLGHVLTAACRLSACLQRVVLQKQEKLQVKKQSVKLQLIVDELRANDKSNTTIEVSRLS